LQAAKPKTKIAEKLLPFLTTDKRLKVAIGGRGASKSIAFGDAFLRYCDMGERLCCAREHQNTIEDSVHALLRGRISDLHIDYRYEVQGTKINSKHSRGEIFYRGLARNIEGFKSAFGINKLWIEEGQKLSQDTIETVLPTIREGGSEIWISANRGASKDAFSQLILKPYEKEVERHGFYEDDDILIVEINYWDNPFFPDVLEQQRQMDKKTMSPARYEHVWEGTYSDTVENAIIEPEWFDACIDAHKVLGFKPEGIEVVAHDPFDGGDDSAALAHRHGSVITHITEKTTGRVNDACDWALNYCHDVKPDAFIWDAGGIGAGLKRQIDDSLGPKNIQVKMFEGQARVDQPDTTYQPTQGMIMKAKSNREAFYNLRAQRYWGVRDRIFNTYLAVKDKKFTDPSELISFSSDMDLLPTLRSELCRIPRKENGQGKIQIMRKDEMKKEGIDSPNIGDCVMMAFDITGVSVTTVEMPPSTGWTHV
jgi:phage terminase large subunit